MSATFDQGKQHTESQFNAAGDMYIYGTDALTGSRKQNRPPILHNLPQRDYTHFIGRTAELQKVQQILRPYPHSQHAFVSIDGIGGIGKSTLALEVAHRFLDQYDTLLPDERFAAIVWTSAKELILTGDGIKPRYQTHRTLNDLYRAIAITLQREDIVKAVMEQQAALLHSVLIQQRTLVIVDNLETIDDEAVVNFIRELPAPTKAIVTTRHRIDVAYAVRLTGMPWEDAERLIAQECLSRAVDLTPADMRRLFDRTGGVPLAIVWSVAQMGFGYPPENVLARLGSPNNDIIRFSFDRSIDLIRGTPAYKLLFALSLFRDGAIREALGIVANLQELDRDDSLVVLEKLSLVNRTSGRFTITSTLAEKFIQSLLAQNAELDRQLRERWIKYLEANLDLSSLVEITEYYMTNAGFAITPTFISTTFLCQPIHIHWLHHTGKPFLVKVLSGEKLDMNLVLKLIEEAPQILGKTPHHIIVVSDHVPTDGAWLQIAAQRTNGINIMPVHDSILRSGIQQNRHQAVLLDYLEERYLGPQRDLYDRQNPISDRLNFFGREGLAEKLTSDLDQGHAVALFGLRKMGKSSLLNYVRDRLSYPAAVIDLQAGTDLREVYNRIIAAWVARLRTLHPGLNWQAPELAADEMPSTRFSRTVRELLDTLTDSGATAQLAVFVDEIELIYPHNEPELATYLDFARTLRGLAQEYLGKFGLIVAGVDPNLVRTNRVFGQPNPFYNFFRIQYLPPLNAQDCLQMIRNIGVQMGLQYTDNAAAFVAHISGGHPFWARKLCSLAFKTWKEAGPITQAHLAIVVRRFIQEPDTSQLLDQRGLWGEVTDHYLWSADDAAANEAILLSLAETEQRTRTDLLAQATKPAAYQRSLIELDARAIIDEVESDAFWIHLQLFRNWIRTDKLGKE